MQRPSSASMDPETQNQKPDHGIEHEVLRRYAEGATAVQPDLCCPVDYDTRFLEIIPKEIIEKDYGCGDPSRHVRSGETVLDLGSGAGKICYILSQKVGENGVVIGVDFNDTMLALAHKHKPAIIDAVGYDNVVFRKGKIQDLALDLDRAQAWLAAHPVKNVEDLHAFEAECSRLRSEEPMIPNNHVDVVVSNCVLNLVRPEDKAQLFREIHRVLRPGGRAVISDIVSDKDPTPAILNDSELWSGCISGAFREDRFPVMFEEAGFYGIRILARQQQPWQVIDGIEFRSLTVEASKIEQGRDMDLDETVIYNGPWKEVRDDFGNVYRRGERMAVSSHLFSRLEDLQGAYRGEVTPIHPRGQVDPHAAGPMDADAARTRPDRDSEGRDFRLALTGDNGDSCCSSDGCG